MRATTPFIETEALLLALDDSETDSGVYSVDAYLCEHFSPRELRKLEWAAQILADRCRHMRKVGPVARRVGEAGNE